MSDDRETFVPADDRTFVIPTWLLDAALAAKRAEEASIRSQFTVNDDGSITLHRVHPEADA